MAQKISTIKVVSKRLLIAMSALMAVLGIFFIVLSRQDFATGNLGVVLMMGAMGAFISQQRNLKNLSQKDLALFEASYSYALLGPIAGAVLAGVLYLLFISGMVKGALFPEIVGDENSTSTGLRILFDIRSDKPSEYAKLLFWSFIAGYSERFVTDIIGRFEKDGGGGRNDDDKEPDRAPKDRDE
jgi:hypothetical protein